jgi:hypothetical protein
LVYKYSLLKKNDEPLNLLIPALTAGVSANGKATKMCLSLFKGELNKQKCFTNAGGGRGYYCEIRIYPGIGIGSVVFFNRTGMSDQRLLDKVDKTFIG